MKNVELKLIVEGKGDYTLFGKTENFDEVEWNTQGGSIFDLKGFHEITMPNKKIDVVRRDLVNCADMLYPTKNISIIINYREIN